MATLKQRVHRYNGSSYDTIHYETEASIVTYSKSATSYSSPTNVQQALDDLYSKSAGSDGMLLYKSVSLNKTITATKPSTYYQFNNVTLYTLDEIGFPKLSYVELTISSVTCNATFPSSNSSLYMYTPLIHPTTASGILYSKSSTAESSLPISYENHALRFDNLASMPGIYGTRSTGSGSNYYSIGWVAWGYTETGNNSFIVVTGGNMSNQATLSMTGTVNIYI